MSDSAYLLCLLASVLFILALKGLSSPETARRGNIYAIVGMAIGVLTTLFMPSISNYALILFGIMIGGIIGAVIARRIQMTAMPQLVAAFHSLVGLAAVLVAAAALWSPESYGIGNSGSLHVGRLIEMSLGAVIGGITFSGSIIAFAKLQGIMSGKPLRFDGQNTLNAGVAIGIAVLLFVFCASESKFIFILMTLIAIGMGFLLIVPIGGADMPVVVSMLNSYSGWAASGIGFTLGNPLLIITGALVGSSGAILSYVMCKAMNRSIFNVIFGGFGAVSAEAVQGSGEEKPVKSGSAEDAAFLLKNASSVIIVPSSRPSIMPKQRDFFTLQGFLPSVPQDSAEDFLHLQYMTVNSSDSVNRRTMHSGNMPISSIGRHSAAVSLYMGMSQIPWISHSMANSATATAMVGITIFLQHDFIWQVSPVLFISFTFLLKHG